MGEICISFVDDASPYSQNLYSKIISDRKLHLVYYAPKGPTGKTVRCNSNLPNMRHIWTSHFYPLQIAGKIAEDKPDLVHIQFELNTFGPFYTSVLILPLLALLKLMRRKTLTTVHTAIPRICFAPVFTESIIPPTFRVLHMPAVLYEVCLSMVYSFVGWFSDALIVHTTVQKKYLISDYHVNERSIFVIPQGVDYATPVIDYGKVQLWKKKFNEKKIVLYFGTITPIKGLEWLIRSFSRLLNLYPESMLVVVGGLNPYYREYFSRMVGLIEALGLKKKVFLSGWLDPRELNALFSLASVVVFSQVFPHASSGTLAMAKKYQKRVIASDFEILKEQLSDYRDAVFVTPLDEKSLAEAMLSALSESSEKSSVRAGNRNDVEHMDSWDRAASETIQLYRRLTESVDR